ncbi:hypothetical protein QSV08_07810 [Maribacter sp. BPC-D8]|uniref:hypothetical protein n=1 Tax=Maribacter sp. BPC-D8 TaxID=3053613 RepID=UPI002B4994C5|nr:hypothetical protein [Maribacter sp. BPC-D8]WRI31150.1 hypothetical protein QSV08_07810 [Maribacter sp. BPC-D8]
MKEVLILTIISGLVFLTFLVTLILGFIKKKKKLKLTSLFLFFAFIACTGWTGYKIVSKTYNKVADTFKPRTGDEIYDALFDKRTTNCIKILNFQDQVVPRIDYGIWLHFETCPAELNRVLSKHEFNAEKLSTYYTNGKIPFGETLEWFNPTTLGDSIMLYEYATDDNRNIQTIWAKLDSTEVFVRDILD